ncbi:uncharacterized protein [Lepisosteus oculatus]|uniref:uncharacterized protein n=1 Tax=Lepisosteus oculatus TaxID=7918 RepID=UPI0035F51693
MLLDFRMCYLRIGVTLILALLTEVWTQSPGPMKTRCQGNVMVMEGDGSIFWGKHLEFDVMDSSGQFIPISPKLATQCGYSITIDFWGNVQFIASVLSCFAKNTKDESFTLTVQIRVSSNGGLSFPTKYIQSLTCDYFPWAAREILCERNYMEVSVRRGIPLIDPEFVQDEPDDWSLAVPEAIVAENDVWQVVFYLAEKKSMTVSQAMKAGYSINTTHTRIVLRAAYNSSESQQQTIQGVPMSVIRSTTFYKQKWLIMMVDTAVACPIDGTMFTEELITWNIPRILPPLVPTTPIKDLDIVLGVNGDKLSPSTINDRNYTLDVGPNLIMATFPVGAIGGQYKSHVKSNVYGITYSIDPFLEHSWQDDTLDKTKYTILHPITTPFMPRPPHVINNTIPDERVFNVTLGTFLPDVELVQISFYTGPLTVPEANQRGYNVQEHTFPNGSLTYTLQVPFEDPNVLVELLSPDTRKYTLPLVYTLVVLPENESFTYPAEVEAILKDVVPPSVTGYCSLISFVVVITNGNLGKNWVLIVGKRSLTSSMAAEYAYWENATHSGLTVPFNSPDVAYELIRSSEIRTRLDLTLEDTEKSWVYANFSLSCSFPLKMIECFSNGSMAALAVKLESVPDMMPSQLTLRDPSCRPAQSGAGTAVFYFNANSCQTTRQFNNNIMTYENEILWTSSRTSYRFGVVCHYRINDSRTVYFESMGNPGPVAEPGLGNFTVVMRLALDVSYVNFYGVPDYPVVKYLSEPLYFEVELLYSKDPQVELFLENCWATASSDMDSSPGWDVIINSCENSADPNTTVFHPVSSDQRVTYPSHLKRFEVKMFSFVKDGAVLKLPIFFHCSVFICDANQPLDSLCKGQCVPGKQRLGRSVDQKRRTLVSSGPVELQ